MSFQTNPESLNNVARKDLRDLSCIYAVLADDARNTNLADGNIAADPPVSPAGGAFAKSWAGRRRYEISAVTGATPGPPTIQ